PTISSNIVFDPSASAGGTNLSGEGLIYVGSNGTTTLSGAITANSVTKFGPGTVLINGNALILGSNLNGLNVQEGTVQVGPNARFDSQQTSLNLNGRSTFDLNGQKVIIGALNNSQSGSGGFIIN